MWSASLVVVTFLWHIQCVVCEKHTSRVAFRPHCFSQYEYIRFPSYKIICPYLLKFQYKNLNQGHDPSSQILGVTILTQHSNKSNAQLSDLVWFWGLTWICLLHEETKGWPGSWAPQCRLLHAIGLQHFESSTQFWELSFHMWPKPVSGGEEISFVTLHSNLMAPPLADVQLQEIQ